MIAAVVLAVTCLFGGVFGVLVREEPRVPDPVEVEVVRAGEWRCLTTADGIEAARAEVRDLVARGFQARVGDGD